ncbi:MAG: DNA-processing protein DprA [Chlorobiales bacterium]|nr:DNA-processing protein DprA [Chlorobiales bacterium]
MTSNVSPDSYSRKIALLVLSRVPGLGPARINAIIRHIGCSSSLFNARADDLAQVPGIGAKLAESIARFFHGSRDLEEAKKAADRQLSLLERYDAALITTDDPLYPPLLKEIYDPPPYLFVRGTIEVAQNPCLAVVGTRKASQYGRKAVEHICGKLVTEGFTIVSGLAYGIDMAAHKTALEHNGKTIAFLAGGVDNPHTDPAGKLWPQIIEQGALISEEWIGSSITPSKFPKRNRLIAGISMGTVIVESDKQGGSLITASYALDQNREVFAVPGSIFSQTSAGTNALIEKGHAKPVAGADDIIAEFSTLPPGRLVKETVEKKNPAVTTKEKNVLGHLDEEPVHIDSLAEKTAMDPSDLLVHLFELELKNLIEQQPGQMFRKKS